MMRTLGKRLFVTVILIYVLLSTIYGQHKYDLLIYQQNKSDKKLRNYSGSVQSVRTESITYSFENGKLKIGKRKLNSIEQFNKSGWLLEEVYFGFDGKLLWSEKNVFSKGRLIETFVKHSPFTFLPDKKVYKYDDFGNLTEESGYNLTGKLVNHSVYAFDGQKRIIQRTSISYHPEEHSKPHRWTYFYDQNGRSKEEKAFSDEGNGFLPTDSLGSPHRKLFVYKNHTEPEATLLFKVDGSFAGMTLTSYDRRENEIEEVKYDASGSFEDKTRYEYIYDKLGNWTQQKTYEWREKDGKGFYRLDEISYQTFKFYETH